MQPGNPVQFSAELGRLFPAGVVATVTDQPGEVALLLPAEAACLGRALPRRVEEFAAGRLCARLALSRFGVWDFPLAVGQSRQPLWPPGFIGSISHTEGCCMAAVARRGPLRGLGIDVENSGRVGPSLWPRIGVPHELDWLATLPAPQRIAAATLLFAAKEAFYKAQFALTAEWVGFQDVAVEVGSWHAAAGEFHLRPRRALAVCSQWSGELRGAYRFSGPLVTAGVAIGA